MKSRLGIGGALVVMLFAFPALTLAGQSPSAAATLAAIFSSGSAPGAVACASRGSAGGTVGAFGTCTANCWDGSTVQCSGTNCNASDSACSAGQQGGCWGSSSGSQSCPDCPYNPTPCYASAYCGNGITVSCQGTAPNCAAQDYCYAYCDGVYYWCGEPC
jgi:hypothetical protein